MMGLELATPRWLAHSVCNQGVASSRPIIGIMLLTINLFTTCRQPPLSSKNIYKIHSCEKSNIPFGYLVKKISLASF